MAPCSDELPGAHGRALWSPRPSPEEPGGAWVSQAAFYTDAAAPTPDRYPAHPSLSLDLHSGCAWAAVLPCPQGRFLRPLRGAGDRGQESVSSRAGDTSPRPPSPILEEGEELGTPGRCGGWWGPTPCSPRDGWELSRSGTCPEGTRSPSVEVLAAVLSEWV